MIDLVFPILVLIGCCIIGMLYSGGFSVALVCRSISASDASVGLMLGSFFAFVITVIFYALRRVLKFTDSMACIPDGFKAMVPAILILTFAWTLKAMTDSLGAAEYVAGVMETAATGLVNFLRQLFSWWLFPCICDRNFLGNIRNFDSNRSCCIPGNK